MKSVKLSVGKVGIRAEKGTQNFPTLRVCLETVTRQTMYTQRNNEPRKRSHCCRGKVVNITYSEYVSAALFIQNA